MPVSCLNVIRTEWRALAALLVLLCVSATSSANPFGGARSGAGLGAEPRFLPVDEAFSWHVSLDASDRISVHWQIAPEYYLYREQLAFRIVGSDIALEVELPEAVPHNDAYFGDVEVYYHQLRAVITLPATTPDALILEIRYQGCAEAGLCYPPERRNREIAR